MILSNLLKQKNIAEPAPNLYFWRDKTGLEIDVLLEYGSQLIPIEIKSAETIHTDFFSNLTKWNALTGHDPSFSYLVYGGHERQVRSQGTVIGWKQLNTILNAQENSS
jgi:predicted AAA+ superfamily ATPase